MDGGADQRLAPQHAGVVDEIAGGQAVGAVQDDVVAGEQRPHGAGIDLLLVRDDLDVGVERQQPLARGKGLGLAQLGRAEQHLSLQVREVHVVKVRQPQPADAGGSQIERCRGPEAARADHEHRGRLQTSLARSADFRQREVAGIARLIGGGQGRGEHARQHRCGCKRVSTNARHAVC